MSVLNNHAVLDTSRFRIGKLPPLTMTSCVAATAAAVTLVAIAIHGFDENGLRLGSQVAWCSAFFVFFAALIAGPLCRLVPFGLCRALGPQNRQMIWSFCAAFGVYLASVIVPNTIRPISIHHEGLTPGMALFVGFCGLLVSVMAYCAGSHSVRVLGDQARRAMLAVGLVCFWLTYALTGLSHISGPHRPDLFSSLSLSLMIAALLLCFADRFILKWKGRTVSP